MYVVRAHGDSAAAAAAVSLGELLELRIETTGNSMMARGGSLLVIYITGYKVLVKSS